MTSIEVLLQLVIAFGLLNVWVFRFQKSTAWRGGAAESMPEEFAVYGLPNWSMYLVGGLKVLCAICLLLGIWWGAPVKPAAILIAALMCGAVAMHIKVNDPLMKSVPAVVMLVMALTLTGL